MESIRQAVRRARERQPAIRRVVLFGSLASGIPTPYSDADLLIVLSESEVPEPQARIPDALAWLRPLPCPVDLVVLTRKEFEQVQSQGSPLLREACETGIDLFNAKPNLPETKVKACHSRESKGSGLNGT